MKGKKGAMFGFFEKEQLHETCLHLKSQVNEVKEYNLILRNQKLFLQNELAKRDKIIENQNSGKMITGNLRQGQLFSANLVMSLKRQITD